MFLKLLSIIVFVTITQTSGQHGWFPYDGSEEPVPEDMPCDKAYCVAPCPGAAAPRYCPANFTACSSGCACMLECKAPIYVCYQIKYCQSRRRYLPKKNTPGFIEREISSE